MKTLIFFFQELGIQNINQQIINNYNFRQYLIEKASYTREALVTPSKGEYRNILLKIDELVQVRNQISHGQSNNESQRLQLDIYIDFIEQYIYALQEVLLETILPFEVQKKGTKLGELIQVIDDSIICVKVSNLSLKIGDRIISCNSNTNSYAQGKIISMQVNHQDKQQITIDEHPINIGIKVNFKVKDNQEFYLIRD